MSEKSLGIGVMGYGNAGKAHAHGWLNMPLYYYPPPAKPVLEAVFGRNRERVELFARKYGFKRSTGDWKDLVKDSRVDVVGVCTPPNLHVEPSVMALESGKHVICEKPMCRNAEEAKVMVRASAKSKSKSMTGYNYRFVPAIMYAKKLIEDCYIGRIFNFRGAYLNVGIPDWGYVNPDNPILGSDWHFTPGVGGYGAISDVGTHILDLARYLIGEIASVSSARSTLAEERAYADKPTVKGKVSDNIEDLAVAALKFQNGALGTLEATWMAPGRKDFLRFEITGSKGSIRFNLERIHELEVFSLNDPTEMRGFKTLLTVGRSYPSMDKFWVDQGGGFAWEYTFINQLHHLADCIVNDKPIGPQGATFMDGYRNCLVMDAMVQSAKEERWIKITQDKP